MSTPPSSPHPGQGGWNQPPAGTDWSPGGYQPTQIGSPAGGYSAPGYGQGAYAPPGQQPYAQDPYGQGGYPTPGLPPAAPKPGTNGFAIAALIFGIIGGVLLSVIFGFVALSQIKKSGQGGRGMAIAGLILSGLWILLLTIGIIVAVSTQAKRDTTTGTVTQGGDINATSLQVGDCVNNLRDTTNLLSLPAVPCSQPHEGEVFAVFNLPAGPYPGAAAVDKSVNDECSTRFATYAPNPTEPNPGLFSVYPLQQNWERGDREVACIATPAGGGTSTGSIKGN